jgi:ankyrin repeat protein
VVLQRKSGALLGCFVAEERQNGMGLVMDLSEEESPDTITALHQDDFLQAARYGDLEDIRAGLAQGISVDCQDVQGRTALHMAAANGHLDIAKLLLDHGAGANSCNMEQNTPLHYAVLNGQKQVVELLISQGANVSAVNRYERTPVDEAISKGDNSLVEYISRSVPIPEQPEGTQDSTDMDES